MQLVRTADPSEYRRDGRTVRVQGFNAHPVVYACIRTITDIVATIPLVVLQEKGEMESKVAETHPLQQLLDYPGARFTSRQFRSTFAVNFLGYGNAFYQMERSGSRVTGLRHVNSESIQQVWIDTEGDPRRYDYANWAGQIVQVPSENMLHFKDIEMGRPFEADVFGYPRGATAIGSMLADNEATNYVRQVVTNDGTPTFAVLMADEASAEDALAMQERYVARTVDRGKRGTPAFFGAVKDIKALGFTLSDLEFPDLRRISREDICAAFGVDPRMIGIASASNDSGLSGAQYEEARARLIQNTVEPMLGAFEDELNHWLAPEFGNVWIAYDKEVLRDLVENDAETSTRIRAEFQASLRTWEESRRALRLSPMPKPTDTLLAPINTAFMGAGNVIEDSPKLLQGIAASSPAAVQQDEDTEDALDEDTDQDVEDVQDAPESRSEAVSIQPRTLEEKRAYWERAMEDLDSTEATFRAKASEQFKREQAAIAALIRMSANPDDAIDRIQRFFGITESNAQDWERAFGPLIAETYARGSRQVAGAGAILAAVLLGDTQWQSIVSATELKAAREFVLRAIRERTNLLANYVGQTTATEIQAAIRAGVLGNLSLDEISRLVSKAVYGDERMDWRTRLIAKTEAAGAFSQGSWDQARESDLFVTKEWVTFQDNRVRDSHLDCMAQGPIAIDQVFSNGLMYPFQPGAPADEVINCRCVLAYSDEPV